jgi:hypothetical protein
MKNVITALILTFTIVQCFGQKANEEVPSAIKAAFAKSYPTVKKVKWNKEGNDYEASFDQGKTDISVLFDATGSVKEVENEIDKSELPNAVKNLLAKDYAGYKVNEAAKIISGNETKYEAEVKKGKELMDLIFAEDGKLVKKMAKEGEKGDKD